MPIHFFMMLIQLKLNVTCFSKFLVISIFHDRNVDIPFILTCLIKTYTIVFTRISNIVIYKSVINLLRKIMYMINCYFDKHRLSYIKYFVLFVSQQIMKLWIYQWKARFVFTKTCFYGFTKSIVKSFFPLFCYYSDFVWHLLEVLVSMQI